MAKAKRSAKKIPIAGDFVEAPLPMPQFFGGEIDWRDHLELAERVRALETRLEERDRTGATKTQWRQQLWAGLWPVVISVLLSAGISYLVLTGAEHADNNDRAVGHGASDNTTKDPSSAPPE